MLCMLIQKFLLTIFRSTYYYSYLTKEETEAPGGKISCSNMYSLVSSSTSALFDSKASVITSKEL